MAVEIRSARTACLPAAKRRWGGKASYVQSRGPTSRELSSLDAAGAGPAKTTTSILSLASYRTG